MQWQRIQKDLRLRVWQYPIDKFLLEIFCGPLSFSSHNVDVWNDWFNQVGLDVSPWNPEFRTPSPSHTHSNNLPRAGGGRGGGKRGSTKFFVFYIVTIDWPITMINMYTFFFVTSPPYAEGAMISELASHRAYQVSRRAWPQIQYCVEKHMK